MAEERVSVSMADGVRLAATLYLPDGGGPWPALLEARPYRKDDTSPGTAVYRRLRDEHGFAVCRVDVRGTGSSEGIAEDEYPRQEQLDLIHVIEWLAERDWSTGRVGMFGTSYSGFNSIQVAMERPRRLGAIAPIFATDDRYTDDVHYGGGIRRALDFLDYPLFMVAMNALPPVPELAGPEWRELWRERLERTEPWMLRWIEEQDDSEYWRHGSLRPRYERIACPTFIVAGWADGYRNATFRMWERLRCPKRMLIGPWSHMWPNDSIPGPRVDLVPILARWFDRWLRDLDDGYDAEPPIVVYVRRPTKPEPDLDVHEGSWRAEPEWPPARLHRRVLPLADSRPRSRPADMLDVRPDVGWTGSIWCAAHLPFGPPFDQREDEAASLVYDWGPVEEPVEVLGYPHVDLTVRSSTPVAFVSAKLCDVFPDGTVALVTRAVLNITHRNRHGRPDAAVPGERYRLRFDLDATSWVFEPGHAIRLDVAGADWPSTWAPPMRGTITVDRADSSLTLPVLEGPPPIDEPPALPPGDAVGATEDPPPTWRMSHDVLRGERRIEIEHAHARDTGEGPPIEVSYGGETGVRLDDPAIAWSEGRASYEIRWPEATVRTEVHGRLESDAEEWHLLLELRAREGEELVHARRWDRRWPRRLQ